MTIYSTFLAYQLWFSFQNIVLGHCRQYHGAFRQYRYKTLRLLPVAPCRQPFYFVRGELMGSNMLTLYYKRITCLLTVILLLLTTNIKPRIFGVYK